MRPGLLATCVSLTHNKRDVELTWKTDTGVFASCARTSRIPHPFNRTLPVSPTSSCHNNDIPILPRDQHLAWIHVPRRQSRRMNSLESVGNLRDIAPQQSFRDRHPLPPFWLSSGNDSLWCRVEVFVQYCRGVRVEVVNQYQGWD